MPKIKEILREAKPVSIGVLRGALAPLLLRIGGEVKKSRWRVCISVLDREEKLQKGQKVTKTR